MRKTTRQHPGIAVLLVLLGAMVISPAALAAGQAVDASLAIVSASRQTVAAQNPTTTVILVRHAEKAAEGDPEYDPASPADPPLNAAGRDRAKALARTLSEAGVTAIYSSEFARTHQTVLPLADAIGRQITTHAARDTPGLVERIHSSHAGGTVVVAGHSNTVPAIIEALGAGTVEAIEEEWEYDNLYFVVVEAGGTARVSTLKYGAHSGR